MNKFDQQLKNKLNQPTPPPFDAWETIEKQLDEPKKKRRGIIWVWFGSVAASIALIGSLYNAFKPHESKSDIPSFVKKEPTKSSPTTRQNDRQNLSPDHKIKDNPLSDEFKESTNFDADHYTQMNQPIGSSQNVLNRKQSPSQLENKYNFFSKEDQFLSPIQPNETHQFLNNQKEKQIELEKNNELDIDQNSIASTTTTPTEIKENEEKVNELITLKEEQTKENTIDIKSIESKPKLYISSYFSPIKMVDDQSILSNNFNSHTIENALTYAYGAKIAYQINDKMRLRSGISTLAIDQRTGDVTTVAAATPITSNVQSLTDGPTVSQHIHYTTDKTILTNAENFPTAFYSGENNRLTYQLQFVEVPIELEYRLFNINKLNISAVAGGSYYFLTKNEIFLTNPSNLREKIGYATNVNTNSFSTNAALKFEYQINKKILFQVEPNYKLIMNQVKEVDQTTSSLFGINVGVGLQLK